MRKLLDGVYADVRRDESHRLADAVQQQLFSGLRGVDPGPRELGRQARAVHRARRHRDAGHPRGSRLPVERARGGDAAQRRRTASRSRRRFSTESTHTRAPTTRRRRKEPEWLHDSEILHVGIDLGTSRSAISASNGERFVVDSFVGWPADMVAKKVLKRDVLIGHEAVANRTMLDLHRPLERGLLKEGSEKDVEAVRELLKHLLRLVGVSSNGKIDGSNVRAVVGVPAAALRTNKQYLRNSMKGIVDSLMIVSEPFAVAYGLDALLHTMIIDIGAGTTDFCVMKGRYPDRGRPAHADHRRRLASTRSSSS